MSYTNTINLIAQITSAFKDVKLDGGIGLSEANAIDDYKDESFKKECKQIDEKLNWQAITSSELNQYYSSLSFFDAKGMRFHLPAFMICELKGEFRFGMTFILTHLNDYSKKQFSLLNKNQRQVITLFLQSLLNNHNNEFEKPSILAAIENYWQTNNH